MEEQPRVMLTDANDALVPITGTTICGSDLHHYHAELAGIAAGDVLGHKAVGVVVEVGQGVTRVRPGNKVVIAFCIACGACDFCVRGKPSLRDTTNPSPAMEQLYGCRLAGLYGYGTLLGGYEGLQASLARVPHADVNLLVIPPTGPPASLDDGALLLLSDVGVTSFHATELGCVGEGTTVAIWGAGPVGLATATWAKARCVSKVVVLDEVAWRLDVARDSAGADGVINVKTERGAGEGGVVKAVQAAFPSGGPDVCIDATGFRYTPSMLRRAGRSPPRDRLPHRRERVHRVCEEGRGGRPHRGLLWVGERGPPWRTHGEGHHPQGRAGVAPPVVADRPGRHDPGGRRPVLPPHPRRPPLRRA